MMRFLFWPGIAILIVLSACIGGSRYGPVEKAGMSGGVTITISAPQNCIDSSTELPLTLRIANANAEPVTLTAQFPLDITITSRSKTVPVLRWSESEQYPRDMDPVIAAGEVREYHWPVIADPSYGREQDNPYGRGLRATYQASFRRADGRESALTDQSIYIGVDSYVAPDTGVVDCETLGR